MPTYVSLIKWTEQGAKSAKETLNRAEHAKSMLSDMGVNMTATYWTIGQYDIVIMLDAPDEKTVTAGLLKVASGGAIRTETLRAFSQDEMSEIVQQLG